MSAHVFNFFVYWSFVLLFLWSVKRKEDNTFVGEKEDSLDKRLLRRPRRGMVKCLLACSLVFRIFNLFEWFYDEIKSWKPCNNCFWVPSSLLLIWTLCLLDEVLWLWNAFASFGCWWWLKPETLLLFVVLMLMISESCFWDTFTIFLSLGFVSFQWW